MSYINSKKYKSAVQLYHKANGDISYYITYKDNMNKLKRIKIGDKSQGITERYCNQKRIYIINKINLGEEIPLSNKKKTLVSFNKVIQMYLEDLPLHAKKRSINDITSKYNRHIKPIFGDYSLDYITVQELEKFQKQKLKELAEKTVNILVELIGTIFYYAIKNELYTAINPVVKIKKFKINNTRDRFLCTSELDLLSTKLRDNPLLHLFYKLAITTGARLETILHIQKKHISLDNSTVILQDLKNRTTYTGFITDNLAKYLEPILDKLRPNHYVLGKSDTKMTSRQIQSRLKPILDKLFNQTLDKNDRKNRVVIHTFRHTFASHLAINGTPIFTIQKLMNHKDIKQTLRYAKLAPESGKEHINQLGF